MPPEDIDDSEIIIYDYLVKRKNVNQIVNELLTSQESITNRDIAGRARVSRQAVHRQLRSLVEAGKLVAEGAGRSVRYRRPTGIARASEAEHFQYSREGLSENEVWQQTESELAGLSAAPTNARSILHYAFTEILNNAIEHSRSPTVEVIFAAAVDPIWFEVIDGGVGIFEHIRASLGLELREHAIEQLTKGKLTTDPDRHTGEGIFFVSKIADYFEIDSGGLRWMVDNRRSDQGIAAAPERIGTRVRFEVSPRKEKTLEALFNEFTEDFKFTKTHQVVKLLERGVRFVSRSEAKRLCAGLERFSTVTLDFRGVEGVGQGFADEVFRVWPTSNPNTRLIATHMNPAVEFMIRRAGYLPPE